MELPKHYDYKESERKWQKFWEEKQFFKVELKKASKPFTIDTPPPTVSGEMHLGHSFSYAHEDFVARYKRMRGYTVFYPFGTDDNGLPTERLVEKINNVKSKSMSRDDFVTLCIQTIKKIMPGFVQDWKNLGMSCDFSDTYSTIHRDSIHTSQLGFVDLYNKGHIYQTDSPTIFCTTCNTTIAQAELEFVDKKSIFNDIIFKIAGKEVVIATTRPELLPACVAVVVHPDDARFKDIIGKTAVVPLFDYEVPIIADSKADPEKGSGVVMCCTFGDKTDIEWWRDHNLPTKIVINKDGTLNDLAGKYRGMKLLNARKAMVEDMKKKGLLVKQEDIVHPVNVHERDGTEVEFLNTKQWYVRLMDKKQRLLDAGDKINWYPKHMKSRYMNWVENLNWDWGISRQRHFGVPFPLWYCKKCGAPKVADPDQLPVYPEDDNPKTPCECGSTSFRPEKDVMDTWATSSMTPQIAMRSIRDKQTFNRNYPMSLRPQAHDIIRTWAFYTIVKGVLCHETIPWKDIAISGFVLDPHGNKMSKSKGNAIAPQEVLRDYGADALRFWAAGSKLGDDMPFQEKDLLTGRKTVTKLWNASKFVIMHLEDYQEHTEELEVMDKWLLMKLNRIVKVCTEYFDRYEYSKTKAEAENFFWQTFCDNYLEIVKHRLYNPDKFGTEARMSAQFGLYHGLLTVLKMFAPIMPHITEEIYSLYYNKKEKHETIHLSNWPEEIKEAEDSDAMYTGDIAIGIIGAIRKFKAEKEMSMKDPISEVTISCPKRERGLLERVLRDIQETTSVENITFGEGELGVAEKVKVNIIK